jgi:UDP-N-acetylglucosamine 2-epimerase (non-hydrolysing)
MLTGIERVLVAEKPDLVFVFGDTNSTLAGALASAKLHVPVGHVEAGLRTGNKYSPFPEEINRVLADALADYCFTPTEAAKANLLREGMEQSRIFVTGNTVVDALLLTVNSLDPNQPPEGLCQALGSDVSPFRQPRHRLILVTGHRRESFGEGFQQICAALRIIAERNADVEIIYPVHLNPNVAGPIRRMLGDVPRVRLIQPVDYLSFVWLMNKAYLILTDSGGVQEEAPSLHKPVLVMRDTTERTEGLQAGVARLTGTKCDAIVTATQQLLDDPSEYQRLARQPNPYGDGKAAGRIVQILEEVPL